MQQLIRPTLLLTARLGLFLTVAAWVVGQSLSVCFAIRICENKVV